MAEPDRLSADDIAAAAQRRREAMALAEIEGNPLTLADTELFALYEREGWSHERRRADLRERAQRLAAPPADGGA
jgi:hypothetical protein